MGGSRRASCIPSLAFCTFLIVFGFAAIARANGRFPAASQLVVRPGHGDDLVLRATFGVVLSHDRGATWDWVCERALGYSGEQDPSVGVTASGTVVVGSLDKLVVSAGDACAFHTPSAELDREAVRDVVVRPDAPDTVYVVTSTFTGYRRNEPIYRSQIFVSRDGGKSFAKRGEPLDPLVLVETLEVAASDPMRLYVGGVAGPEAARASKLLVSRDEGATWDAHTVPTKDLYEHASFVSGVAKTNADRVYVRSSGKDIGRLLVSDDAGASFRTVFEGASMLGFALSGDGKRVFVGMAEGGLHMANTTDFVFQKRSPLRVRCLATFGATLYACSDDSTGFAVGASDDEGMTFTPRLALAAVRGPVRCPSEGGVDVSTALSTDALCTEDWATVRDQLRGVGAAGSSPAEAVPTATAAPAVATSATRRSRCSCATPGVPEPRADGFVAAAAAAVALVRRWQSRRNRHAG